MRVDSISPVPPVEPVSQARTAESVSGQNGSQSAPDQTATSAGDSSVVTLLTRDGKTIVYRTVDQKGDVVEQIPSEQILALRRQVASLLQAAERKLLHD